MLFSFITSSLVFYFVLDAPIDRFNGFNVPHIAVKEHAYVKVIIENAMIIILFFKRLGSRGFHDLFNQYLFFLNKNITNTSKNKSIIHLGEYFQIFKRRTLDRYQNNT